MSKSSAGRRRQIRALFNIEDRLRLDSAWQLEYDSRFLDAKKIVADIPLIHVLGRPRSSTGYTTAFWELVRNDGELDSSFFNHKTRDAEAALGMPRCVYFYAGKSFPVSGSVALAFGPEIDHDAAGTAAPFDTGGLVAGWINAPSWASLSDRIDYGKESIIPADEWREEFRIFVAAFFGPLRTYVQGLRPYKPDPDGVFEFPTNSWRAWTFERHLSRAQKIRGAIKWCAPPPVMRAYHKSMRTSLSGSDVLSEFLARAISPRGDYDYGDRLEEWVQSTCFREP